MTSNSGRSPEKPITMPSTATEIEQRLTRALAPLHLDLLDESAKHVGHRGATSGGGHFQALIVSAAFEGLSLLDRHRRVNEALSDLFGERIHAFGMTTLTPQEWAARRAKLP